MMSRGHLNEDELGRLRRRELPAGETADALRHIASCDACAARAREASAAEIARVRAVLAAESEPPAHLSFEEVAAFVEGTASAEAAAHVASCEVCRAEAEDLAPLRAGRRASWWWTAAIAAAILIALLTILLRSRQQPAPDEPVRVIRTTPAPITTTTAAPRSEWQRLVDDAVAAGRLPFPNDLEELRRGSETLRGPNGETGARLQPSGIVVEETQPHFTWPETRGATYVVSVFDGETPVAASGPITVARWTPPKPLPRGRTYTWQVEAGEQPFPTPPAPPARFRIAGAREHDDLRTVRRTHPDDHLLLAVLYARAGLEREAARELAASRDPRASRIAR